MASALIPTASVASQAASSATRLPPPPVAAAAVGTSSSVSYLCPSRPGRPSLNLPLKQKLLFSSKVPASSCGGVSFVPRAQQMNDVVVGNDTATSVVPEKGAATNRADPEEDSLPTAQMSAEAVTEFMSQVSDLVRLIDCKDVVELQLKQPGCELLIRKKEALPQPPAPQVVMMPSHAPPPAYATPPPPAADRPPAAAPASAAAPAPAAPKLLPSGSSSSPQIKSPMAGTFYRSPAPGQPPFVNPGDRVKKGQVLCIIEAMKLMNEIEADHEGTMVDILVEDGKPVGVGQPLFVIEP